MNVVLEGGLEISCFQTLSQDFFAGIPVFALDSSKFLRIPVPAKSCLTKTSN